MITRLRYDKHNNVLVTRETIIKEGVPYSIKIDTTNNIVTLNNPDGVLASMEGKSLHDLKIRAKLLLKNLGFTFKKERRKTVKKDKKVKQNELQSQD